MPHIWGDGTILKWPTIDSTHLEDNRNIDSLFDKNGADTSLLYILEPAPEYMIRLYQDFEKYIVRAQ